MSKSKKNYPEPELVINKHGADAIRMYLINSPAVRGEELRFNEASVKEVVRQCFIPWNNACKFLLFTCLPQYEAVYGDKLTFEVAGTDVLSFPKSNRMDRWITSLMQSLNKFVRQEMQAYRLYNVLPRMVAFIDQLTNIYIRMNRRRLNTKDEQTKADTEAAIRTCFGVIYQMNILFAPFVPFITEYLYQQFKQYMRPPSQSEGMGDKEEFYSVHYEQLPPVDELQIDLGIEKQMMLMQDAVNIGRLVRDRRSLPFKCPLPSAVLIHRDLNVLDSLAAFSAEIEEELNLKQLLFSSDRLKYGVGITVVPQMATLGKRLRREFAAVNKEISSLNDDVLEEFIQSRSMDVCGHTITIEDVTVRYILKADDTKQKTTQNGTSECPRYEAEAKNGLLIIVDCEVPDALQEEYLAREVVNRIQKLRKEAKLHPQDAIEVYYQTDSEDLCQMFDAQASLIDSVVRKPVHRTTVPVEDAIAHDTYEIKEHHFSIFLASSN